MDRSTSPSPSADDAARAPRPPVTLRLALLVLLVEVGAMAALAVSIVAEAIAGHAQGPFVAVGMAVFFLLAAMLLIVAGRGLYRGARWGRAPVVTWQLLVLAIAASQRDLTGVGLTIVLVALPVLAIAGIIAPTSRAWIDRAQDPVP